MAKKKSIPIHFHVSSKADAGPEGDARQRKLHRGEEAK